MGDLWGLTGDGWIAIATFLSSGVLLLSAGGVFWGVRREAQHLIEEREADDVRRYLIDEGASRLVASIDECLGIIRQNYFIGHHLVRFLRDIPAGKPGSPTPLELPRMIPFDKTSIAFSSIRPASRLVQCKDFGFVMTSAFATLANVQAFYVGEVELSVRSFYASAPAVTDEARKKLANDLAGLLDRNYIEAERFLELAGWLQDALIRAQEMRVRSFGEIQTLSVDPSIVAIAKKVQEFASTLNRDVPDDIRTAFEQAGVVPSSVPPAEAE